MNSIFLAAATRSGSTHIANSLVRCGLQRASVHSTINGAFNEEHSIDPSAAAAVFAIPGLVFQSHVRGIGRTPELLKMSKVPTVVTCRNIFDSLLSFKESTDADWARTGEHRAFVRSTHIGIELPDWGSMSNNERFTWVGYTMIPWYLSFYVSWKDCGFPVHWVWYDEYFADQVIGLTKILEWAGIPICRQAFCATLPTNGKMNVGVSGRGLRMLPAAVVEEVYNQIDTWGSWRAQIEEDLCRSV